MSLYDNASLVMIPSGVKEDKLYSVKPTDGSGDFTFSRGSDIQATRVNSSGLIEKAKVNNLPYSNDFGNAAWVKSGVTATSGQSGYDGSNDAWLITKDSGTFRVIYEVLSYSGVQTFSFYAKGTTAIRWRGGNNDYLYQFDLATATATSAGVYSAIELGMEDVGGGWYRCYGAANFSARTSYEIYADWNDPTILSFYLQDAQLNHGLIAQDYVETTSAAVVEGLTADLPRLDYHNPDSPNPNSCPSLLLEPSRTNLATQSEYFGAWTKAPASITITDNAAISPEGVQNAAYVQFTGGNQYIRITASGSSATYTGSVYVKGTAGETIQIAVAGSDSGLKTLTGGWDRIDHTATDASTHILIHTFGGATARNIYTYAAQVEAGSYPTSYIPTYSAAANRGADVCNKTSITDLIGQTEGSVFFDFVFNGLSNTNGATYPLLLSDASGAERFEFVVSSAKALVVYALDNGSVIGEVRTSNSYMVEGTRYKIGISYSTSGGLNLYINGTLIATDALPSIPSNTAIYLNDFQTSATYQGLSPYNQVLLFKSALTNAELASLTTI